jgi:hypothetical protein
MAVSTIDNSGISASAAISTSKLGTGAVLQVLNLVGGGSTSTSSGTPTSTGLTLTITPSSTTSKILILASPMMYIASTGSDVGCGFYIYRGSTQIYADTNGYDSFYTSLVSGSARGRVTVQYLDSPATTSATVYTIYIAAYNGSVALGQANAKSQMTIMEIAA